MKYNKELILSYISIPIFSILFIYYVCRIFINFNELSEFILLYNIIYVYLIYYTLYNCIYLIIIINKLNNKNRGKNEMV